jgi:DNA-directed RNA polymerase subunit D
MKIEIKELKPKKAVIKIEDIKPYFVNSIRRIMISELPKLAIEDVVIYDNTSALFDEIISHRLGMLPIPTDFNLLTYKNKCVCKGKGCPNCTVRYTLSKEGEGIVFSGDLQPAEKSWAITEDKIPIVELFNDQRLILEVEAVLGKGRDHAKWQGVIAPSYKMDSIIELDAEKIKDAEEFIEKLPQGLAEIKGNKIEIKDMSKLSILESYIEKEKIDFITIKKNPDKVIFSFETDGSFTAKDAILESVRILENKYSEFTKLLKDI